MGWPGGSGMTDQQDHRHQCEVRYLIAASRDPQCGRAWVVAYLGHPKVRGRADQLRQDINDQRAEGNTGEAGTWL